MDIAVNLSDQAVWAIVIAVMVVVFVKTMIP